MDGFCFADMASESGYFGILENHEGLAGLYFSQTGRVHVLGDDLTAGENKDRPFIYIFLFLSWSLILILLI
jgi:hypothetical protein